MIKYIIANPKNDTYLNNIHCDLTTKRPIGVNLIKSNELDKTLLFSSFNDAESVVKRLKEYLKIELVVKSIVY